MLKYLSTIAAITLLASPLAAGGGKMNGQRSASSPTIVQTAAASGDHSTLVAAVQAAGLADTLSGPGPFTVFAPTNSAFAKLPPGTVASLLRAENRDKLQSILTYHVVPGRVTAADLVRKIKAGRGQARIATVQGGILTARMAGKQVVIVDANGGTARVSTADLMQSNGVIHVTDAVSLPK